VTVLGVLGPLVLRGPAGPVRVGSARQRRVLAALAAHLGRPVEVGLLVDLVWPDAAPADPTGAVQTNVARLRRLLPAALRLETTPEGYRLVADRAVVDVTAFTDQLAAAGAATEPQVRLDRLTGALSLWRGRPFCELDHPSLEPEVARLSALRVTAAEQQAEALLATGRAGEAIAAAEALVTAEPLREGAVGVLMRALVAAGRQSDALVAFARLRARLDEELGLDPAPELRELEQRVLRQELPAPVTAPPARPVSAPRPAPRVPVSSFVGRAADLARAAERLATCRVVTFCGPGGVGKTRLAQHTAAAVADRYADGVLVVEFGEGGPDDVEPLLAAALRLTDGRAERTGSVAVGIVEVLAIRNQLLVLDNCEHVADEVARLVEAITAGAPGVDLLLTSREPLRVDGEHVLPVAPLEPDAAARLLVDRMRAGDPAAAPDVGSEIVAEVCRRLDGLPLALELAAARALPLGLRGLLDALTGTAPGQAAPEPFAVLRGGRRTASPRHRSLREVVAWSYGLLDEAQRTLFDRLSVFAGPVEYAAVGAVCGDATALPDLVDRSLVVRHPGEPARFGMLETLRAFGRSRLVTDPSAARLRARHAAWAARLADEVAAARRGSGEAAAIHRFDTHLPDLRRAHAWLCAHGPLDELLRLTVPVAELGYLRGRADLVLLLEETLRAAGVLEPERQRHGRAHPLMARLLGYHAHTWWQRGNLDLAERQARRALEVAAESGDPTSARDGHEALANVLGFRGDLRGALEQARRSHDLAIAADDVDVQVMALADLAIQSAYAGDQSEAARHESELAALVGPTGSVTGRAFLAYVRGECRAERGDPAAVRHLQEAVAGAEEAELWFVAGVARHTLLTSAARTAADPADVLPTFGPLIDHWHAFGSWTQLWMVMRALAETLSRLGRHHEAALMLGALIASPRASRVFGADLERIDGVEAAARGALGAAYETRVAEGAALGDAAAVALARRLTRSAAAPSGAPVAVVRGLQRSALGAGVSSLR
jgi:predicted ATPase/DNA-binding SARP family transcriptional activator